MTGLPINEIHIEERPSNNNTSKDADASVPKEVTIVCSTNILSVQKDTHLSKDIQTKVGGYNGRSDENNKVGFSMKAKDKSTTETGVVSDEKSKSDIRDAKEGLCCLDTRVVEDDLKENSDKPTSEVDLKSADDEQSNFENLEEEETKSTVAPAAEALNKEVGGGKSSGDYREIIVDSPIGDSQFPTEENPAEVKNQTFPFKERKPIIINKIKEDKAKQPIAVMITTRPSRKKARGTPKSCKPSVALNCRKSTRSRSTSVEAEKFGPRKMTRRKSTGSSDIGRGKKSNCSHIIEHNLYIKSHSAEFRRRINNVKSRLFKETKSLTRRKSTGSCDIGRGKKSNSSHIIEHNLYLRSHSSEFRRRINNVKSRLFKETKSFVAYKSARHKETQERRNRAEEIARKTKYIYADRSIDFSKKSKRQREDIWRRRTNRR